jgi:hypothetical protein
MSYIGQTGPYLKQPPRIRNKRHLAFLHELPCVCTGAMQPIVAHHLLRCESRLGMGGKAGDQHTIPLLHSVHVALHHNGDETSFLAGYGIDAPECLANLLYENTGNFNTCIEIIQNARE